MTAPAARPGRLAALGLDRPVLRAWAMYDWAISAMQVMIMTAVFPIYYVKVAGAGLGAGKPTQALATANTVALLFIALLSPILGALADYAAVKKRLLAGFMLLGVAGTAAMFWIHHGDLGLASALFIVVLIGGTGSFVFYEALLPHIASREEMDRVSTAGYAIGYVGGGVLLALSLAMIQRPAWFGLPAGADLSESAATLPTRLTFVATAVWWLVFSIPLFRRVPEPPRRLERDEHAVRGTAVVRAAFVRLGETFRELRGYRQAFLLLLAFLIYNDGIQTIIRMATTYGAEIGLDDNAMIGALLVTQFIGIPFAFLFGMMANRVGAKRAVFAGLSVYAVITVLGYYMRNSWEFFALAVLVGMVQGGTQALSRSLFASLIPRQKSSEFFAFFGVFERYAGILGPAIFAWVVQRSGTSRNAILSVVVFFILGAALLAFVDVEEGRRVVRAQGAMARAEESD